MTEEQVEREVERRVDALDARLMQGELSQAEYDQAMWQLSIYAEEQFLVPQKRRQSFTAWWANQRD